MFRKIAISALLALIPLMSSAQKTVTASGTYTYYAPMNITPEQAELTAVERAKIDIIGKEFGTVMGVRNYTQLANDGDESSVKFLSLGESEVGGEWLETIGKPAIHHEFANNLQVITVEIKGRIREIKAAKTEFEAKILRNGTSDRNESSEFRDGDNLCISFQSPVSGYLAIYLYDLSGVNRLLPLKLSGEQAYLVPANTRRVFFVDAKNGNYVYKLVCKGDSEVNRIYIVFSPNKFSKANDTIPDQPEAPASMDFDSFQKWLGRCRRRDREMTLMIRDIIIRE